MPQEYTFEPYDLLQLTKDDGKSWVDYYTIRDAADASEASRMVRDTERSRHHRFRIVRDKCGRTVVFGS